MAITASDIELRQSGSMNLGGAIASGAVSAGLFDFVSRSEATDGDVEYRCFYLRNSHPVLWLYNAAVWISTNTPSPATAVQVGVGVAAVGGEEPVIASESVAPAGVSFFDAGNLLEALPLGDLPPGQHKAIWLKRTITPGALAYANDGVVVSFRGDSEA